MRLSQLQLDQALLIRLVGIVIDRPVLEKQVRRMAAQPRMDLQARSKEELAQALVSFSRKQKALDEWLGKEVLKGTAMERERLTAIDDVAALGPVFQQKRTGAKFLLAMLLSPEPWPERAAAYIATFTAAAEQRHETLTRAETAGLKDTLLKMEEEFSSAQKQSLTLEQKVMTLERERASVVAQLGQREAELRAVAQKSQLLERELSKKAPAADTSEADELRMKLRRLEKQAAFARERERDREQLQRVEHERDVLLRELHLLRTQLHLSTTLYAFKAEPHGGPPPKPPRKEAAKSKTALYVDGANIAGAARLLYQRGVNFAALRDLLAAEWLTGEGALLRAYVIDNGADTFAAFAKALKGQGYHLTKTTPKTYADGTTKANLDVHLAVDVMADQPGPTRVVLVTGDSDFVPLAQTLRGRGVRVEAAMFKSRAAKDLVAAVDRFWQLDETVLV